MGAWLRVGNKKLLKHKKHKKIEFFDLQIIIIIIIIIIIYLFIYLFTTCESLLLSGLTKCVQFIVPKCQVKKSKLATLKHTIRRRWLTDWLYGAICVRKLRKLRKLRDRT